MTKLMICGAAVYAGGMAAEHAASTGLAFVLASREKRRTRLKAWARQLGVEARVFSSVIRVEWPLPGTAQQFLNDGLRGALRSSYHWTRATRCLGRSVVPESCSLGVRLANL